MDELNVDLDRCHGFDNKVYGISDPRINNMYVAMGVEAPWDLYEEVGGDFLCIQDACILVLSMYCLAVLATDDCHWPEVHARIAIPLSL